MMSIAETSKPLGLREAHFRAIRRDDLILQSRKPVPLSKTSKNGKRHYETPDGRQVPSVTTVLF